MYVIYSMKKKQKNQLILDYFSIKIPEVIPKKKKEIHVHMNNKIITSAYALKIVDVLIYF